MSILKPHGEEAARWLEGRLPQMDEALAPLVEVNSFTGNREGGNKVGELLCDLFRIPGLESQTVPGGNYADHRVFRSRPGTSTDAIALIGHLDTVFPPGKFEGFRKDGPLRRGPGVLDMKGGLVVIAFALKALAETRGLDAVAPLRLAVVSDEEVGSPTGQPLIREVIAGCKAALVFESGRANDAVITRRKGTGAMTAIAHGKAAHAGNAHAEGRNAIWALSRFIDRAQSLTNYDQGVTINVGKVEGGYGKNTVPDRAQAELDLRFCTHADAQGLIQGLEEAAKDASKSLNGTRIELEGGVARAPLERSDASARILDLYGACARASGLGFSESPLVGGGSDASTSSSMGIPSIDALGPRGKGFHTLDEHIEAETLVPKAQALARILAALS